MSLWSFSALCNFISKNVRPNFVNSIYFFHTFTFFSATFSTLYLKTVKQQLTELRTNFRFWTVLVQESIAMLREILWLVMGLCTQVYFGSSPLVDRIFSCLQQCSDALFLGLYNVFFSTFMKVHYRRKPFFMFCEGPFCCLVFERWDLRYISPGRKNHKPMLRLGYFSNSTVKKFFLDIYIYIFLIQQSSINATEKSNVKSQDI